MPGADANPYLAFAAMLAAGHAVTDWEKQRYFERI
jgi:glutamine synthetase